MPRLIPCPSCHAHVVLDERRCPHCSTELRTTLAPRAAGTLLLGLMLAGCPADDSTDDGASSQTTNATTNATSGTGTVSTTSDVSISGSGGVEYGTPDTGIEDDGTSGTTGGTATVGEPEYGVPETTTGATGGTATVGEPEYGVPETTSG